MFASFIQIVGLWFVIAIVLETLAVFVEQIGAARSPEDEAPRHRALSLLAFVLSLGTPSLLIAHGYFATQGEDQTFRILAMGAPIAAVLVGALLGAILGAAVKGAAPLMRKLALPLDIAAVAAAIYAALPTIQMLIQAAQGGAAH